MEIDVKSSKNEYRVILKHVGWTYTVPYVYIQVPFLFWKRWKFVWSGKGLNCLYAARLHKKEMFDWCEKSVREYEDYEESWSE